MSQQRSMYRIATTEKAVACVKRCPFIPGAVICISATIITVVTTTDARMYLRICFFRYESIVGSIICDCIFFLHSFTKFH